ncbi:MAG: Asp-tRNA(Asn)/Glu-tRNA(Gln) amidotransferase subunit GatC [Verrucomicrobiota bacterium]
MSEKEFDVGYVAELCRLELSDEETARYQEQLSKVLHYMQQVDAIDVSGIEPTAHANPVFDVLRKDEERECLDRDEVLKNAPQSAMDQFAVTKVVE